MLNRFHNGTIIDFKAGEDIKNNDIYILDPVTREVRKARDCDEWLTCQLVYVNNVSLNNHIKSRNPNVKFLLENVKMKKEYENVITEKLGVEPMQINSECLSAQKRNRLYWFNWNVDMPIQTNNLVIKDILQPLEDVEKEYYHKRTIEHIKSQGFVQGARMIQEENSKCECLLARDYKDPKSVVQDGVLRRLTPIEYERLQTLPDNFTSGVCKSHRYTAIGNG